MDKIFKVYTPKGYCLLQRWRRSFW